MTAVAERLAHSSIPTWARSGAPDACDPAAWDPAADAPGVASYLLVGIGEAGATQVNAWAEVIAPDKATWIVHADADGAASGLRSALSRSVVGVRVLIAGPAGACLRVRAVATGAGLEDDEYSVVVAEAGAVDVFCSHCRTTNQVEAAVDDVIECSGCHRNLLVYHHVSRRTGAYLGFMVDAESPTAAERTALQDTAPENTAQEVPR